MLALTLPGQLDWCKHGKELESGTDISVLSEVWAAWLRDPVPGQWSHASLSWLTHTLTESLHGKRSHTVCPHPKHKTAATTFLTLSQQHGIMGASCFLHILHAVPEFQYFHEGRENCLPYLPTHCVVMIRQHAGGTMWVIRLYFTYIGLLAWLVSGENIESIYWVRCAAIYQRQL